ncbi:MAG: NAD-dependent epimerase/dehydratase family protein [Euryarchaeota archaeon]|jgi:nucleoside-diphosphate-sugar epimerase|nr:NAD-dependent epimerase/dehydratase family protein [Euryarchaeota archaeon]MBT4981607.1 NAD-dependent epimerase/dehydratase family protein [Euryarchaeota archaeon]MBT5184927.1 NAD-dependent epimerase/dehydratase family protein [Euryarchaeota archaeon]
MRVLVTGGAGFLGSHLTDALLGRGDEVVVFDDLSRGSVEQIDNRAKFEQGDVRLESDWERICSDFVPDVIHHLAAVNGTRRFHNEADLVVDVNINGTRNALAMAKRFAARLVFYSSPESFGEQESMPLSNDSNSLFTPAHLHQRHSYGSSKHIGELLCQFEVRNGLDVRIARPFNAYGPRLHGNADGQVVAMMMQANPIVVHGNGQQTRSLTWVGDIIDGLLILTDKDELNGQAFNLGSTEEVTMLELAQRISNLRGVEIVFGEPNLGDSKRRLPDLSMNESISWKATTTLQEGLAQLR